MGLERIGQLSMRDSKDDRDKLDQMQLVWNPHTALIVAHKPKICKTLLYWN